MNEDVADARNTESGCNFMDFGFCEFRGNTFLRIWISDVTPGMHFRGVRVQFLEVRNTKAKWSFSSHHLQAISLKFSTVKKELINFRGISFFGGSFSRDLNFADR